MANLDLGPKQLIAWNVLADPFVVDLLFGGGAGGGKTILVTSWMVVECRKYPGITIGLGRKEMSNLGKTTVASMLAETFRYLVVRGTGKATDPNSDFTYRPPGTPQPGIYFRNGSSITLHDLAYMPSDPNYDRFGSLPLTHAVIEEVGELDAKAVNAFSSRKDRKLNREYGITGKTVMTCNPSNNFAREEYYDPYVKLGGGNMQSWPVGDVYVDGKLHIGAAKRVFIQSLPTDNPFLPRNYIETLKRLPDAQRRRLLEGDWDFDADEGKLIAAHLIKTTTDRDKSARSSFGCDPSHGGDGCTFVQKQGGVVVGAHKLEIPQDDPHFDKDTFIAQAFIDWVTERGGGYEDAALDANGIGAGVLNACNRLGWYVSAFIAGSTQGVRILDRDGNIIDFPLPGDKGIALFNNIRSQGYVDLADAMVKGALKFLEGVPYFQEFRKDFAAHKVTYKERQTIVESKSDVKKRLGRSPDFSDALLAADWVDKNRPPDFDFEPSNEGGFFGGGGSTIMGGLANGGF